MTSSKRPVYILGAGFSKAINSVMPITDELGEELSGRLQNKVNFSLRRGQSFEDWLTLQLTALPFLEGHANARRFADASAVIAEIAVTLDARMDAASEQSIPNWLVALVHLWNAENALIISFNYDLLVERAATDARLVTRSGLEVSYGEELVFPAPPPTSPQYMGDMGANHSGGSFQVLKMHGSLNWYGSDFKSSSGNLLRMRDKRGYEGRSAPVSDFDYAGLRNLDRYLIPPITSKDGYYSSALMASIWRAAGLTALEASSLTIMGYSLPSADRVTGELVTQMPNNIAVRVVDPSPESVINRLGVLGVSAVAATRGQRAIENYVADRVEEASKGLVARLRDLVSNDRSDSVYVYRNESGLSGRSAEKYGLAVDDSGGLVAQKRIQSYAESSSVSTLRIMDILRVTAASAVIEVRFSDPDEVWTAIGFESLVVGGVREQMLLCVPPST